MKTCITCKHKSGSIASFFDKSLLECKHPCIPASRITGKPTLYFCSTERRAMGSCGPEGRRHEPI